MLSEEKKDGRTDLRSRQGHSNHSSQPCISTWLDFRHWHLLMVSGESLSEVLQKKHERFCYQCVDAVSTLNVSKPRIEVDLYFHATRDRMCNTGM